MLKLARELSDFFRLRDWQARLDAATLPDLCGSLRHFASRRAFEEWLLEHEVTLVLTSHPSEIRPEPVVAILAECASSEQGGETQLRLRGVCPKVRLERPTVADEVRMLIAHFDRVIVEGVLDHIQRIQSAVLKVYDQSLSFVPSLIRFHTWVGADRDGNPSVTATATYQAGASLRNAIVLRYQAMLLRIAQVADDCGSPAWQAWLGACRNVLARPHLQLAQLQKCMEELNYQEIPEPVADLVERFVIALSVFGFHLASLEWRENSALVLLADHETQPSQGGEISASTQDLLASLRALARLRAENGPAAVGALIISNCETAETIIALERLARQCGVFELGAIPVVPLLESVSALQSAPRIMEQLLQHEDMREFYRANHNRIQVMLGYSDAAKDGGRLMADTAIYQAQAEIADVAARYHIKPYIFHGRGGSPARGCVDISDAFAELHPALPAGILKQTEQGEVVANRYGHSRIAASSLDHWFLECVNHSNHNNPTLPQRNIRQELAVHAYRVYRALRDEPDFLEHLLLLTPLAEVCHLPLSSRPAARVAFDGGTGLTLERLRAIPISFSMNIARIQLLAWYGTGSALAGFLEREGIAELRYFSTHDPHMRISLNRAARGLVLSDVDEFCAQAQSFQLPSAQKFAEKIKVEAWRLHEACHALGVQLPARKEACSQERQLHELVATLSRQGVSASDELKATTFAAVAALLGMTG